MWKFACVGYCDYWQNNTVENAWKPLSHSFHGTYTVSFIAYYAHLSGPKMKSKYLIEALINSIIHLQICILVIRE